MVEIAKFGVGYAFVAPPGINPNQRALNEAAAASGRERPPLTLSLGIQAREVGQLGERLAGTIQPYSGLDRDRGVVDPGKVGEGMMDAYRRAALRMQSAAARANGQVALQPAFSAATSGANIASVVSRLVRDRGFNGRNDGNDGLNPLAALSPLAILSRTSAAAAAASEARFRAGVARDPKAQPFDRKIPVTMAQGGPGEMTVSRVNLSARAIEVNYGGEETLSVAGLQAGTAARPGQGGFAIRATMTKAADTLVIDTRDPAAEDGRLTAVDVDLGDGSDVLSIVGNNYSLVRAGAGDDMVTADGESVIYGGDGNDHLVGRTVIGDAGNDQLFATSFAAGGAGNDLITLFSRGGDVGGAVAVAFGGEGDDTVISDLEASVDGGEGDDRVVLRAGGQASGGAGADLLTAVADAELDGGDGDDDLLLMEGGLALGGAGADRITATGYGEIGGGAGNDNMSLLNGGIVRFNRGDGADRILMSVPEANERGLRPGPNAVSLDDLLYADVTVSTFGSSVRITVNGTTDSLDVSLTDPSTTLELRFGRGPQAQLVTVTNGAIGVGPLTTRSRVA